MTGALNSLGPADAKPRFNASPGDDPVRLEIEIATAFQKVWREGGTELQAFCSGGHATPGVWQTVLDGLRQKGLTVHTTTPKDPGVFMLTVSDPDNRFFREAP